MLGNYRYVIDDRTVLSQKQTFNRFSTSTVPIRVILVFLECPVSVPSMVNVILISLFYHKTPHNQLYPGLIGHRGKGKDSIVQLHEYKNLFVLCQE